MVNRIQGHLRLRRLRLSVSPLIAPVFLAMPSSSCWRDSRRPAPQLPLLAGRAAGRRGGPPPGRPAPSAPAGGGGPRGDATTPIRNSIVAGEAGTGGVVGPGWSRKSDGPLGGAA